jgi:hypothetical protein
MNNVLKNVFATLISGALVAPVQASWLRMLKKKISKAIAGMAIATGLCGTIGVAQAQDYAFVAGNLNWSTGDHGFNEGAQCGVNALQGIAGIALPNVPFVYQILGNAWDRTNMMGAAQVAFRMGYVAAAVNTAICSQIHNGPVHQGLAQRRDLIIAWFNSR